MFPTLLNCVLHCNFNIELFTPSLEDRSIPDSFMKKSMSHGQFRRRQLPFATSNSILVTCLPFNWRPNYSLDTAINIQIHIQGWSCCQCCSGKSNDAAAESCWKCNHNVCRLCCEVQAVGVWTGSTPPLQYI